MNTLPYEITHAIEKHNYKLIKNKLKKNPKIIFLKDTSKNSFLHLAIFANDYKLVKLALKNKVPISVSNGSNRSDIHIAVRNGNHKIFKLLIKHSANPLDNEHTLNNSQTYITSGHCGCGKVHNQSSKEMTFTLSKRDPILKNVVLSGNKMILHELIKLGANVNCEDNIGFTPLHYAIRERNLNIIKLLIKYGADINYQTKLKKPLVGQFGLGDSFGTTPFHYAVKNKLYDNSKIHENKLRDIQIEIIKYLLNHDAKLNVETQAYDEWMIGRTVNHKKKHLLTHALNNIDIFMVLYPYIKNNITNITKLHYLAYSGNLAKIKKIKKLNLIMDEKWKTPIHLAIRQGHILIVKYLMRKCKTPFNDFTLFEIACKHNRSYILSFLLDNLKHKKNYSDELGKLLPFVIKNRNLKHVDQLVRNDANVNIDDDIALDTACKMFSYEIVTYLLKNKAKPKISTLFSIEMNYEREKQTNSIHIVRILIDYGLDINEKNKYGKIILDEIIKSNWSGKRKLEMLIVLLTLPGVRYNLDELRKKIKLRKENSIYDKKYCDEFSSKTSGSGMDWDSSKNWQTFLPIIEKMIQNDDTCLICEEYNANFKIEKCGHQTTCSECIKKLTKCPRCNQEF